MSNSIEIFNRKMATLQPPQWRKRKADSSIKTDKTNKDKEIQRLREALEVILDAAQKDEPCVLAIKAVAYMALKGGEE